MWSIVFNTGLCIFSTYTWSDSHSVSCFQGTECCHLPCQRIILVSWTHQHRTPWPCFDRPGFIDYISLLALHISHDTINTYLYALCPITCKQYMHACTRTAGQKYLWQVAFLLKLHVYTYIYNVGLPCFFQGVTQVLNVNRPFESQWFGGFLWLN